MVLGHALLWNDGDEVRMNLNTNKCDNKRGCRHSAIWGSVQQTDLSWKEDNAGCNFIHCSMRFGSVCPIVNLHLELEGLLLHRSRIASGFLISEYWYQ